MAKRYQKRPSEILNIDNDYLAYCFDEVALYLELEALDDKGNYNWNKFRWKDKETGTNKDLIQFVQNYG
ncbi:hypothetical protein [Tissierella sp.]|uniref:hypothetical protein n=1 Tax=Tissierella sp. TaxID=41274 RepID=UPI0028ABDFFC|nr:hypothetical protein [Tissierella sp.]